MAPNGNAHTDIDTLKGVLESPEESIRWLLSILDSINNGVMIIDDEFVVRYLNDEYTRITGVPRDGIMGRPLRDVRPGAKLPDVVRSGKPLSGVFRREGDIDYVVDLAPIVLDGKIKGGIGVFKDITEVERLSKELQRILRQTDRLKAIVNHAYPARYTFDDIVGASDGMRASRSVCRPIADSTTPIRRSSDAPRSTNSTASLRISS